MAVASGSMGGRAISPVGGPTIPLGGAYNDDVMIRCNHTHETWYVSCLGDQWIGEYGNCSTTSDSRGTYMQYNIYAILRSGIYKQGGLL